MEIYTELTNKEIDEVLKICIIGSTKEKISALWELTKDLEGDDEFKELVEFAKKGVQVLFDIRKIINGEYEEYPDTSKIKIRGYKIKVLESEFRDEIDIRIKIMKNIIRDLYDEGDQEEPEVEGHD